MPCRLWTGCEMPMLSSALQQVRWRHSHQHQHFRKGMLKLVDRLDLGAKFAAGQKGVKVMTRDDMGAQLNEVFCQDLQRLMTWCSNRAMRLPDYR